MGWVNPAATIKLWLTSTARVKLLSRKIRKAVRPAPPNAAHIISMRPTEAVHATVKSTAINPNASNATRSSPDRICSIRYHAHNATRPHRIER